jgi:cytosine permease
MIAWGIGAALLGLLGIQYVAKVATFLPLIPLITLLVLLAKTASGIGSFNPQELIAAGQSSGLPDPDVPVAAHLDGMGVIFYMVTYIVGFFATAGAAGVDFGMNNRDKKDVSMGGLVGIALAIIFTAGLALLIVAGTYGNKEMAARALNETKGSLNPVELMPVIIGADASKWVSLLLAISAFPSACFSSFIAANSFKTTLPKVNPFISVGIGAAISVGLALSGYAGDAAGVFGIIGASFGPICGAMTMDYLLSGNRWSGPRAGFNPAGWLAWALGLVVGLAPTLHKIVPAIPDVPMAPVAAYVVGAVVYLICAKAGLITRVLPMPQRIDNDTAITTA